MQAVKSAIPVYFLAKVDTPVKLSWFPVCRYFNTLHECNLLQIVADVHLFQEKNAEARGKRDNGSR